MRNVEMKMNVKCYSENQERRDQMGDLFLDRRIILKWILNSLDVIV
jgi:hypothetical protein